MKTSLTILCIFIICQHSIAQQQYDNASIDQQKAAMSKLFHWVGEWKGTGWSTDMQRQRKNFEVTETISVKLQGLTFLIEGKGWYSGSNETAHEALAILSFEPSSEKYRMRTYDLGGSYRETELVVHEDNFRWSFRDEATNVLLRFTIEINQDTWFEYAEVSPDEGSNWYRILEMNLTKQ
jgi:hypothetical protein